MSGTDRRKAPPDDFDENPEWTEKDFDRARPADELHGDALPEGLVRPRGRPKLAPEERKVPVSIRLSPDVARTLRESGLGWQTRADDILRDALGLGAETRDTREEAAAAARGKAARDPATGLFKVKRHHKRGSKRA